MLRRFAIIGCAVLGACTLAQPLGDLSSGACRIDGVKNGDESDVDCGGRGSECARCRIGSACRTDADCLPNVCSDKAKCTCPDDMSEITHQDNSRTCMDDVEVSNAKFGEFLVGCPDGCSKLRPEACALDTSLAQRKETVVDGAAEAPTNCYIEDETEPPSFDPDKPVVCIDWCAAFTYCAWRGRRLCGLVPGAPQTSEFLDACGAPDRDYPYAPEEDHPRYDACACNAGDENEQEIDCPDGTKKGVEMFSVDQPESCKSTFGPINLVGNASEWQDICRPNGDDPLDAQCNVLGGSYASGKADASCKKQDKLERNHATSVVGFRCCSG